MVSDHAENNLFIIRCNSVVDDTSIDYEQLRDLMKDMIRHSIESGNDRDLYYRGKIFQLIYILVKAFIIDEKDGRYGRAIGQEPLRH